MSVVIYVEHDTATYQHLGTVVKTQLAISKEQRRPVNRVALSKGCLSTYATLIRTAALRSKCYLAPLLNFLQLLDVPAMYQVLAWSW